MKKVCVCPVKLGKFFGSNNKNNCLRELNGTIKFTSNSNLMLILGVYFNEILIFEETEI